MNDGKYQILNTYYKKQRTLILKGNTLQLVFLLKRKRSLS